MASLNFDLPRCISIVVYCFNRVVYQIYQNLLELVGVEAQLRNFRVEGFRYADAVCAVFIKGNSIFNDSIQRSRSRFGFWQPGEFRELVYHTLQRSDLTYNCFCSFADHGLDLRKAQIACIAPEFTRNSLCGELDRSKGILYFVSHPARHLAPRGRALRFDQLS